MSKGMVEGPVKVFALNIVNAYAQASMEHIRIGNGWYRTANLLAEVVGGGNVRMGAGVIAALSPNKNWSTNQALALRAKEGELSGHVGDALGKARRIMEGEDPDLVLPEGKKTWHFFHNILTPEDPQYVTVDRHAYRVATSDWGNGSPTLTPRQYAVLVSAYQVAAGILGDIPSAVQAVTWCWARER
jgi:hypothetical protein